MTVYMTAAIRDRRAPAMTTIVAVAGPSVTGGPARPTRTRAGGEGSRRQPARDGRDSVGDATLLRPLLRSVVLHLTYPKFVPLASVIKYSNIASAGKCHLTHLRHMLFVIQRTYAGVC